jgi:hypothetical protein
MAMQKYRKKPVVIEAARLTEDNWNALIRWVNGGDTNAIDRNAYHGAGEINITIRTLEGEMRANVGDWIIKGVKGEFYPCRADIFVATYEPAGE